MNLSSKFEGKNAETWLNHSKSTWIWHPPRYLWHLKWGDVDTCVIQHVLQVDEDRVIVLQAVPQLVIGIVLFLNKPLIHDTVIWSSVSDISDEMLFASSPDPCRARRGYRDFHRAGEVLGSNLAATNRLKFPTQDWPGWLNWLSEIWPIDNGHYILK